MESYLERQAVEKMKTGELSQFLVLFDSNFEEIYRYIFRRVNDAAETERLTRLVFLDALSKINETPLDMSYLVWMYGLAKERTWEFMKNPSFDQQKASGFIALGSVLEPGDKEFVQRANNMFGKLSIEEREIMRLKFFEELSDGDVANVLNLEGGDVSQKIYRVLKRAHFLLFGESDERQGVYFGELSGFMTRIRDLEDIDVPDSLRLNMRVDLEERIKRKDFSVDESLVKGAVVGAGAYAASEGSDDPAKIFVEAVREMREEEAAEEEARIDFERRERRMDFFDRWKFVLALIPAVLIVTIVAFFLLKFLDFTELLHRGFPTTCVVDVDFEGDFTDGEKRSVNEGVSDRICDYFDVDRILISRAGDGAVEVEVDVPDWMLEYKFVRKVEDWRIKKYARTLTGNGKSGEV